MRARAGSRATTTTATSAWRSLRRNDKPVFVGIARTKDVSSYLRGTSHATLTDVDFDPFRATYRTEPGASRPAAPAGKRIWAASAHGTGAQRSPGTSSTATGRSSS